MPTARHQLSIRQQSLPACLASWLVAQPRALGLLVLLGVALASPSLATGVIADDRLHELLLRGQPGIPGLAPKHVDLFHFANGDPALTQKLMNHGVFPWWTDRHVVLAFLRPIAGATHWLDHRLWPGLPALMHLQSLLWLALLLATAGLVYRTFSPTPGAALLALLLLAIDDAHAPAVSWIANRSLTIAMLFVLLALLAHDRARRAGGRRRPWLGPALLGTGLLAGEAALTGAGYLLAYALFLDKGSLRSRLASLVNYALVIAAWRAAYVYLGYGASGSGVYLDPGAEPLVFARAALTRIPVLLLGTFGLPWSDLWDAYPLFLPALRPIVLGLALVTAVALVMLLRPLLRSSPSARFWSLGCVLSLVPSAATFPHDRLLLGTTIGAMGALSELFLHSTPGGRPVRRLLVGALGVVHLLLAPVLLAYRSATAAHLDAVLWQADESIPKTKDLSGKTLVIVNPPLAPFASFFPIYRAAVGLPRPRRFLWLATGVSELHIRGVDSKTLSVRPQLGYLTDPSQLMLRSLTRPFVTGEKVTLDEATFEIVEVTPDGRPAEVVVHFERDLSDPHLLFLHWGTHGYVPFDVPGPGATVVVPRADLLAALSG